MTALFSALGIGLLGFVLGALAMSVRWMNQRTAISSVATSRSPVTATSSSPWKTRVTIVRCHPYALGRTIPLRANGPKRNRQRLPPSVFDTGLSPVPTALPALTSSIIRMAKSAPASDDHLEGR